ncbi:hypothetical protein JOB18_027761 [Solea senegalensis]|uniref:Uncharacterized protein n=1 Tax=Solea senegalensis TaxID=28829 RepID=A0AAV6P8M4_SOLSE|nr:hypothetical protein JOB18_027761 [Solea senegalensis]
MQVQLVDHPIYESLSCLYIYELFCPSPLLRTCFVSSIIHWATFGFLSLFHVVMNLNLTVREDLISPSSAQI